MSSIWYRLGAVFDAVFAGLCVTERLFGWAVFFALMCILYGMEAVARDKERDL
jgi:hypothetical protein